MSPTFPIILDAYTTALNRLRDVCVELLGEEVIFANQDHAESPRPPNPYTCIQPLSDVGIGQPAFTPQALSTSSPLPATPDVRKVSSQTRETLCRVTCFGSQAFDRAVRLSMGYSTPAAKALWVDVAIWPKGEVRDETRLIGQHWEPVAYVDFMVRYVAIISDDIYSIQTVTCPVTVT